MYNTLSFSVQTCFRVHKKTLWYLPNQLAMHSALCWKLDFSLRHKYKLVSSTPNIAYTLSGIKLYSLYWETGNQNKTVCLQLLKIQIKENVYDIKLLFLSEVAFWKCRRCFPFSRWISTTPMYTILPLLIYMLLSSFV